VAGRAHVCALSRGRVICWGENRSGQLGQPPSDDVMAPAAVPLAAGALAIAAGDDHTCARTDAGGVSCWGRGDEGQLGDGRAATSPLPVAVALPAPAQAIAAGRAHTCALLTDGRIACWGRGGEGQLGVGSPEASAAPVIVVGLGDDRTPAVALGAGGAFTCALVAESLYCWGDGGAGQTGSDVPRDAAAAVRPTLVPLAQKPKAVVTGGQHTCVLDEANDLRCFGLDAAGQLGTGRLLASAWPRPVSVSCP
jgi:alpha-tubulin suppressor-like RCC1 family protein